MKENPITDALGEIDPTYIAEAETAWQAAPLRPRARLIPIAALIAILVCAVGFTMAGRLYFAPGMGIIDEDSLTAPQVWACYDEITLGGAKIDAVVLSEGNEGYNLTVWVWRGEEVAQDPGQAMQGIPPKELSEFDVLIDGAECRRGGSHLKTSGFSSYTYQNVPFTTAPTLRDSEGNTTTVRLKTINETQYGYLRGIRIGKEAGMALVPVSGTENVFVAELTDPRSLEIARGSRNTYAYGNFLVTCDDGTIARATGDIPIKDAKTIQSPAVEITKSGYGRGVTAITPYWMSISHTYDIHTEGHPRVTVTVPERGEGYDCNEILLDAGGIIARLTRVEYGENGLQFTVETENNTGSAILGSVQGYVHMAYSMGPTNYTYLDGSDGSHEIWPREVSYNRETGALEYMVKGVESMTDGLWVTEEAKPGDELVVILDRLSYDYMAENVGDLRDPQGGFGTFEIK
ncbi:MAG: hypothetical protein IKD37_02640 [Clostridia bacterium]|nr:hypothetical protein [Clostridia bacterium]